MTESLSVKVISPQNLLFFGKATSVSSRNTSGNFDVLPEHTSFITIIIQSPIVIRPVDSQKITLTFSIAVMYVTDNNVTIYAQPEAINL